MMITSPNNNSIKDPKGDVTVLNVQTHLSNLKGVLLELLSSEYFKSPYIKLKDISGYFETLDKQLQHRGIEDTVRGVKTARQLVLRYMAGHGGRKLKPHMIVGGKLGTKSTGFSPGFKRGLPTLLPASLRKGLIRRDIMSQRMAITLLFIFRSVPDLGRPKIDFAAIEESRTAYIRPELLMFMKDKMPKWGMRYNLNPDLIKYRETGSTGPQVSINSLKSKDLDPTSQYEVRETAMETA
jgi:hypothetical protein